MDSMRFPADVGDGAILGSEYCSGYIDLVGQWNTGFYCPNSGENSNVFCCGTQTHKYCCTKKDQMVQEDMEGITVLVGFLVGASSAIILLTIISCICCPRCPNYRRKVVEKSEGSTFYQGSHVINTATNHTNHRLSYLGGEIYRQGSNTLPHSHTLPHTLSHHQSFRAGARAGDGGRKYGTLGRETRNNPPTYHLLPRSSYLLIPQDTPDLICDTRIHADTVLNPLSQSLVKVNIMDMVDKQKKEEDDDIYQSTKF